MEHRTLAVAGWFIAWLVWGAGVWAPQASGAESPCVRAAGLVERELGLPGGLLRSIGAVETGNRPWSVDSDGTGSDFASASDAVAFVRRGSSVARFVDVGCFQVDLAFHPAAFRTLEEAFDPVANARAAGEYLLSLRRNTSSWNDAVARYHSGQIDRGGAYAARVYASLGGASAAASDDGGGLVWGMRVVVPSSAITSVGWQRRDARRSGLPIVCTP